eukprot:CAMPEP_0184250790 /NCGR_PEP_ID=MMETSP0977-20130417/4815_1 /TAXON_ID=483370 /ORGANISM="non described non described, Strain CCMP2097" /LENGTH=235 /DNA_ID=CAMNT_0026556225 /DNA_START=381 /DNA_END=1085 /DNA_ORIENTATION=-
MRASFWARREGSCDKGGRSSRGGAGGASCACGASSARAALCAGSDRPRAPLRAADSWRTTGEAGFVSVSCGEVGVVCRTSGEVGVVCRTSGEVCRTSGDAGFVSVSWGISGEVGRVSVKRASGEVGVVWRTTDEFGVVWRTSGELCCVSVIGGGVVRRTSGELVSASQTGGEVSVAASWANGDVSTRATGEVILRNVGFSADLRTRGDGGFVSTAHSATSIGAHDATAAIEATGA